MFNVNCNFFSQPKPTVYYCSRCGGIIDLPTRFMGKPYCLCEACYYKYRQIRKNTPNVSLEDFIKEVEFKVGDQVITSDGRVGCIIDICTCDKCKERGFDEPEVRYINGDTDYITISDKNNEFKNFYSIGNKVFGNLDEAHILSCISARKEELQQLEFQLDVINSLKNK